MYSPNTAPQGEPDQASHTLMCTRVTQNLVKKHILT